MANTSTTITPRVNAWAVKELLKNMQPEMFIQNLGNATVVPQNVGDTINFRRYLDFVPNLTPITEGTNNLPNGPTSGVANNYQDINAENFQVKLLQYGGYTSLTDKLLLTHQDPLFQEAIQLLGTQAGKTIELIGWNVLSAATNAVYTGTATSVATVAKPFTIKDLRRAVNVLENNDAEKISKVVASTPGFGSSAVPRAFYGLIHTDLKFDLLNLNEAAVNNSKSDYFVPYEKYANVANVMQGEIGTAAEIRFLASTLYKPALGAGAVIKDDSVRTTTVGGDKRADVYNMVILGRDAYSTVAIKGAFAARINVSIDQATVADPYNATKTISWKVFYAVLITNPRNIVRIVTASAQ